MWHEGTFSQLGGSDGLSMAELTDGKATEEGAYGRFCWGGVVSIADSWNVSSEHPDMIPAVLLNGGTLNAEGWIDERCEYQLWRGTITAPNLDVLPGVHLLGDSVTIIDPQG